MPSANSTMLSRPTSIAPAASSRGRTVAVTSGRWPAHQRGRRTRRARPRGRTCPCAPSARRAADRARRPSPAPRRPDRPPLVPRSGSSRATALSSRPGLERLPSTASGGLAAADVARADPAASSARLQVAARRRSCSSGAGRQAAPAPPGKPAGSAAERQVAGRFAHDQRQLRRGLDRRSPAPSPRDPSREPPARPSSCLPCAQRRLT